MSDNIDRLRGTLNFMQSAIKSGEAFTETVAAEWCQANDDLDALSAELSQARRERDEWKQAAGAEAHYADELRAERDEARRELAGMTYSGLVTRTLQRAERAEADLAAMKRHLQAEQRDRWKAEADLAEARKAQLLAASHIDWCIGFAETSDNMKWGESLLRKLHAARAALSAADTAPAEEQVELRDAWHPTDRELRRGSPSPGGEPDSGGVSMPELGVASTTNLDTCPIVPDDEKCPTRGKLLAFDDGLYYCDHLDAERERRCPDMLKRYRPADTEGGGRAA